MFIPALGFLVLHFAGDPKSQLWIGAAIFGGIGLLPGIGLFFLLRKLGWKLYLFKNGFVHARGRNRVILWGDVKSLYEEQDVVAGIRADARLKFTLLNGGWAIIDSSYKNFPEFADGVRAGVTRAVLLRAKEMWKAGKPIAFGKLQVTREGLAFEGEELAWADVGRVAVESYDGVGYAIRVYPKAKSAHRKGEGKPWYSRAITEVPNSEAFLKIAAHFTKVETPGEEA
jgi:hypothetical protein